MKTLKLLFIGFILLQWSCKSQTQKINGLSFVASRDSINTTHTKPVVNVNANYVALMPFGFIRDIDLPTITHNTNRQWFGETDAGLIQYTNEFRKSNIKIMVKPQIWIWKGIFTGLIEMKTEENWQKLEQSYSEFILTYAKTAQKLNAEIFCIGTELEKFVMKRPNYWKKLIKEIRSIYKGKLTYASNWDEFSRVPFWSELDFIGVDAYFPLSEKQTPTIEEFEKGWQTHKSEIFALHQKHQKPVLFTEYGYRSVDFNGKQPWNADRVDGNINLEAQTNGLQAIHNQFWNEDWFAGGFVWKWFHRHDKVGGLENNRFTPQNKPAEKVLKELYAN